MYIKNKIIKIGVGIIILFGAVFFILRTPDIPLEDLKEKYTNDASKFIKIDGLNVHYRQEGTGPDLLLIHGTASSLHTWDGWVNALKNDFRITRMDLPAFGLTGARPDRDYSIGAYVEFIDHFIEKLGIDTLSIAGNSLGGGISWNYTLQHPEKIKKLILLDASAFAPNKIPFVFTLARNDLTASILKSVTPRSFIEKNIKEVYFDDEKITDDLIDRYHELTLSTGNRQAFVDRARLDFNYEVNRIKEITTPTLIMWGKYDEWILYDDAQKFMDELSNAELITYEAGHIPMEELPKKSAEDAKEFLQK